MAAVYIKTSVQMLAKSSEVVVLAWPLPCARGGAEFYYNCIHLFVHCVRRAELCKTIRRISTFE